MAKLQEQGVLRRLLKDRRGNTLAMVGAGLVPLAGIIGGGVDMSRAYMVKTRLQQACDAGVLAGRRAMNNGTYDSAARAQTESFFAANFPAGYLDTTNLSFVHNNPSGTSRVEGTASVELPTVVMKMFGADEVDVSLDCEATLEISNSDITFVVDTTGSMSQNISTGSGGSTTKIAALRAAMKSFYDTLKTASTGTGARIRYGLVPYSGTVNVGELVYDLDKTYLMGGTSGDTYAYETRRPIYEYTETSSEETEVEEVSYQWLGSSSYLSYSECEKFSDNQVTDYYNSGWRTFYPSSAGYSLGQPATVSGQPGTFTFSLHDWSGGPYSSYKRCTRRQVHTYTDTVTTTTTQETYDGTVPGATFNRWEYTEHAWPVTAYVDSIKTSNPAVKNPASTSSSTHRWAGCIEERETVASNDVAYNSSSGKITPAGAFDLDIDAAPGNALQKWRPYWPNVIYYRNAGTTTSSSGTASQTACPIKSQLLTEMTETNFDAYADALNPDGGTYHDIGMLWGARISSPQGIFSDNVTASPSNGGFVTRHLIFMTDGILDIGETYYSAYGVERHDGRIGGGSESTASQNHIERFSALCSAVKAKGIRVWVIAFDTSLTTAMSNCASANSSFVSMNSASLNSAFTTIATTVADLRLSK